MKQYKKPQIKVMKIIMDNSLLAASVGINDETSDSRQLVKPHRDFEEDSWDEENTINPVNAW